MEKEIILVVENRNVSEKGVIPEGANTYEEEEMTNRTHEVRTEETSKRVNVKRASYKDALVRSN